MGHFVCFLFEIDINWQNLKGWSLLYCLKRIDLFVSMSSLCENIHVQVSSRWYVVCVCGSVKTFVHNLMLSNCVTWHVVVIMVSLTKVICYLSLSSVCYSSANVKKNVYMCLHSRIVDVLTSSSVSMIIAENSTKPFLCFVCTM